MKQYDFIKSDKSRELSAEESYSDLFEKETNK